MLCNGSPGSPNYLGAVAQIPALFVYGSKDMRPSWPAEKIAYLMPDACFVMIDDGLTASTIRL